MEMKFELYQDISNIKDSLELESGTTICRLTQGEDEVVIEVRGEVCIDWYPTGNLDDECDRYNYASDFPAELMELIKSGNIYYDRRAYIHLNNWFEIFYNDGEDYDVAEGIEGYNPTQLFAYCLGCMNIFKEEN